MNNEHDKTFRTIFDNKDEVAKLIKDVFNIEIGKDNLQKYKNSFIDINFRNKESDIIYKVKDKDIFFLIEHQTKIDYTMPLRILKYEILIIESAIDQRIFGQKNYKIPIVYPIVLYTGNKKWNADDYISNIQQRLDDIEKIEFAKYNVIDVNEYNEKELLEAKSFYTKAMLIEKAKNTEETVNYLEKITNVMNNDKKIYTFEIREMFEKILNKIIRVKIGEDNTKKILKNFNMLLICLAL